VKPVELFHIGPQKTATTWVYRCLQEHPQVAVPPKDSIHYFDMFYACGRGWYETFFAGARPEQKLFDPTPSYIRSPFAAGRIAAENPNAKIALSLRHPVERAFSHYWHEKKKRSINFSFPEVLENYDLFSSWIEPGLYARHLERFLKHFPREQILCQRFDDLERDPRMFLDQLLEFFELDRGLTPSVLHTRVNAARPPEAGWKRMAREGLKRVGLLEGAGKAKAMLGTGSGRGNESAEPRKMERLSDVPLEVITRLNDICKPEIARLEHLLGMDLSEWRSRYDG
jgi:hypothetical protein